MYSTTTVLYLSLYYTCWKVVLDRGTSMIFLNVIMLVWKTLLLFLPDSLPAYHSNIQQFFTRGYINKNMSVLHYDFIKTYKKKNTKHAIYNSSYTFIESRL